jgi:hypothetical protein
LSKENETEAAPTSPPATTPTVEDADFVETEPTEKPKPRVARVTDVSRLESADPFGGPVNETANARARGEPKADAPKGKRGRKPKAAPAEPVDPSTHLDAAKGIIAVADSVFRASVRGRYADDLTEENLSALDKRLALTPAEMDALAGPLAQGLAENGVELPWWAQLAMAGVGLYGPKLGMLASLDKQVEAHRKAEQAAP